MATYKHVLGFATENELIQEFINIGTGNCVQPNKYVKFKRLLEKHPASECKGFYSSCSDEYDPLDFCSSNSSDESCSEFSDLSSTSDNEHCLPSGDSKDAMVIGRKDIADAAGHADAE
ncbi:unnamed protein product, partial [Meganyctiphanes norvegica]